MTPLLIGLAYLIGSLQFGVLYSRLREHSDIRGDDLPGGSGIYRKYGLLPAIGVSSLDVLKGVLVAWIFLSVDRSALPWGVFAVVTGHNYPVFFGFNGGVGIATGLGSLAITQFSEVIGMLVLAFAIGVVYKYTLQKQIRLFVIPFSSAVALFILLLILGLNANFTSFWPWFAFGLAMALRSLHLLKR